MEYNSEEEFLGFETEDVERVSAQRNVDNIDDSDISVSSENEDSSENESESESEQERHEPEWTTDDSPVVVPEFTEETGATWKVPENGFAVDFFLLMFEEELFELLASETNRNAEQQMRTKPDPHWYRTSADEIRAFVGVNIFFGIKHLPETRLYWSKNPVLAVPSVQKIFPRNRFEKIRQYLHLNNRENNVPRDDPRHDKLFKVRLLSDSISRSFRDKYLPSKFVSIDEAMVKYKERLGFKQYLPLKPVKRGIKVWVRADATNGFVCELQVYTGKQNNQVEQGLGYRVVSDLVRSLHGKKYHIFCDNFFITTQRSFNFASN